MDGLKIKQTASILVTVYCVTLPSGRDIFMTRRRSDEATTWKCGRRTFNSLEEAVTDRMRRDEERDETSRKASKRIPAHPMRTSQAQGEVPF